MPEELPGGCRIPPRDVDAAIRHAQEAKTWKDLAQVALKKQLTPREKVPTFENPGLDEAMRRGYEVARKEKASA